MITDKWLSRLFGVTVCLLAVMASMTFCALVLREIAVPDPLDRFLTFLVGALVGRITGSRTAEVGDAPQPVTINNTSSDPIPVTTGPGDVVAVEEQTTS